MDLERHIAHLLLYIGRAASGADLLRRARLVLVLIVVEIDLGNDLHGRQRSVSEDRAGKLPALDHLLDENIRSE